MALNFSWPESEKIAADLWQQWQNLRSICSANSSIL